MKLEEDIKRCKELIKEEHSYWIGISNQKAIETLLQESERKQIIIENQKIIIQDRDREIIELNQKYISERIAKEEVEELLENSISTDLIKDKIQELEKEEKRELKGMKGQDRYYTKQMYMYRKMILKELLQDKKEKKW